MSIDNPADPELAGYNKKHERIRGTHELKYPPKESRCKLTCGSLHYEIETRQGKEYREHPCFLAIGHVCADRRAISSVKTRVSSMQHGPEIVKCRHLNTTDLKTPTSRKLLTVGYVYVGESKRQ